MPKVFISYSHDSEELKNHVKNLADTLILNGIETSIDQYSPNPNQGWPAFMLKNMEADYILCVCTENYKKRFELDEDTGIGRGTKFEGQYIKQYLFENEKNDKIIPILFDDKMCIPDALSPYTYYKLNEKNGFENLYRYITTQPRSTKPKLGSILSLDVADDKISEIVFGETSTNIEMQTSDISGFFSTTPFFDFRMGQAFPGLRGGKWFTNSEEIINRFNILLREPLSSLIMTDPIWWFRGRSCLHIDNFEVINSEKFILEHKECVVDKIYAYSSSDYYRSFVYVLLKPEKPVGVYDYSEDNYKSNSSRRDYEYEEYGMYDNYPITRNEYDDGASFVNGKYVDFGTKAKLRIRYLSKYNFIICAKFNPINSDQGDEIVGNILKNLLHDDSKIDILTKAIEKLPKLREDN